jgi:hypothetical protein
MTLTLSEISEKIHQILWGKSFVDVVDGDGTEHTFILRSLSINEQNAVKHLRRKELALARHMGILSDEELKAIYAEDGVWTEEQEKRIEDLQNGISQLAAQIKDFHYIRAKKNRLEKIRKKFNNELTDLLNTRLQLFHLSAEQRAEEVARRHVVFLATQTPEEEQYWGSKEEFDLCEDICLLFNLAKAYFQENQLTEATCRQIARSGEWRFRWHASKKGESLFGRPISDWSEAQNALVFWSQYYDSVYDSLERPPNHVIEDDSACDQWVEDQNKKHVPGAKSDRSPLGNKTATKNKDHQEVFMMVQKDDEEAIKEVQDMNPSAVRSKLRREYEQIKNAGGKRIKEWDLGTRRAETPSQVISKGNRKGRK